MLEVNNKPVQPLMGSWREAAALIVLVVAAAGLRSAVIAVRWQQLSQDPDAYRLIAENLRKHGVYSRSREGVPVQPTAFRPPLYPSLLATIAWQGPVTPQSVAALHLVLGTLSVLLAWILAQRWQMGRWSYLVAIMVACDPILLNQSAEVMTETLATFMALACLLTLTRLSNVMSWKTSLLTGMVFGLAVLCRPTFLIWFALVTLWIAVSWRRWIGVRRAAVMLVGLLVVMAPWVVRNQQVMGRAIVATTHGGYTLLLGNNPSFYRHMRTGSWGSVWDARELQPLLQPVAKSDAMHSVAHDFGNNAGREGTEHPEIVADHRLYKLAHETIRHDPAMFAFASLVRVLRLWSPLPHRLSNDESPRRALARWGVASWYAGVFLVALVGLGQLKRRALALPWVWGLLSVLALTAVHTVYWSNMRMRAPAMPVVYLVFAFGCRGICRQVVKRMIYVNVEKVYNKTQILLPTLLASYRARAAHKCHEHNSNIHHRRV